MHYHLEVVMPPTDDVHGALEEILAPFDENKQGDEDGASGHAFWDYWVIGGRWAGAKAEARIGKDNIAAFYEWCREADIKVLGLTMGKQTVATTEMREAVDAKWREMFPGTFDTCPLFDHANNQLGLGGRSDLDGDVCRFADVPASLSCAHIIFAGPSYNAAHKDAVWTGPPRATFMLSQTAWNGVTHMPVAWDGIFSSALAMFRDKHSGYKPEYAAKITPTDDWIVVTVDYHY